MRKPSGRFPRKRGNAFCVRIRDGLYSVGVLHNGGLTSFADFFLQDPQSPVPDDVFSNCLFSADVQMSFFAKSEIYRLDPVSEDVLRAIPLSREIIRIAPRPYDPAHPFGLDGPFPYSGGSLVELADPAHPATSSSGRVIKETLDPVADVDVIRSTEISVLWVNWDLKERLAACHAFGGNVDPYKARIFEDCAPLQNDIVRQTHWFIPHRMPLLGVQFDLEENVWREA